MRTQTWAEELEEFRAAVAGAIAHIQTVIDFAELGTNGDCLTLAYEARELMFQIERSS